MAVESWQNTVVRNFIDFASITKHIGIRQKPETHSDYYVAVVSVAVV